jgi:peptidoglycan/LPS O-acetylase OafA/YrhL
LYAINIAVWIAIYPMLSDSPRQHEKLGKEFLQHECRYWWSNLLYIHNLFKNEDYNLGYCYDHGWFLSVDMQLYVLTPIVLVPLYHLDKRKKWMPHVWMFLWVASSVAIPAAIMYAIPEIPGKNSPGAAFGVDVNNGNIGWFWSVKPFWRYAPYVCGVWGGYILHKLRGKSLVLPNWAVAVSWAVILGTFSSVVYGNAGTFVLKNDDVANMPRLSRDASIWCTVLISPAWGIALTAMIVLCHNGYGGPINTFLSYKAFVPLSRLTYGCYLIHVPVMFWYWYTRITPYSVDDATKVFDFFGHLVVTMCVSFVLSMGFEFPILKLEKIWLFSKNADRSKALK